MQQYFLQAQYMQQFAAQQQGQMAQAYAQQQMAAHYEQRDRLESQQKQMDVLHQLEQLQQEHKQEQLQRQMQQLQQLQQQQQQQQQQGGQGEQNEYADMEFDGDSNRADFRSAAGCNPRHADLDRRQTVPDPSGLGSHAEDIDGEVWVPHQQRKNGIDRPDAATGDSAQAHSVPTTLLVRRLPSHTVDGDLYAACMRERVPVDKVTVCVDGETGACKSYGFVDLSNPEQTSQALRVLNGIEVEGASIVVEVYRPKFGGTNRAAGEDAQVAGGCTGTANLQSSQGAPQRETTDVKTPPVPPAAEPATQLFVGGLSFSATDEMLKAKFSEVGEVLSARIIIDHETGRPKGFAFVDFATAADADRALRKMQGQDICGKPVRLGLPTHRGKGGGGPFLPGGKGIPTPPGVKESGSASKESNSGLKFAGTSSDRRKSLFGSASPTSSRSRSKRKRKSRRSRSRKRGKKRSSSSSSGR